MEGLLQAVRPTFPDARMERSRVYPGTHLAIIETSFLVLDECVCDQFHFLIPLHNAPVIRTDSRVHVLKEANVFPCNPMQPHQVQDTGITNFQALVLYLDKTLIQTVARDMYGSEKVELRSSQFVLSPLLRSVMDGFVRECRANQPGCPLMLDSLSVQAATLLLRECHHNLSFPVFQGGLCSEKSIAKAIEYITDNYQNKMSLYDLASETHYSPHHFLRLFRRHTGRTPFEFLIDLRIERAKSMLRSTDYSVAQIADMCGFSGVSHFSQAFKRKTGLTATQFRRQHR